MALKKAVNFLRRKTESEAEKSDAVRDGDKDAQATVDIGEFEVEILQSDDDANVVVIKFVDGLQYRLQYPGNRLATRYRDQLLDLRAGKMSREDFLDPVLENCVFPENHSEKPTFETIKKKHIDPWALVLQKFLAGDLVGE